MNKAIVTNTILLLTLLTLVSSIFSCQSDTASASTIGHKNIEQLIAEAYKKIDKTQTPYPYNSEKAEYFKKQLNAQPFTAQSVSPGYNYCVQLLLAGKTLDCIFEIENLLHDIEKHKVKNDAKSELAILKLKGLAYIRLGEQENCFTGNPDACIIPTTSTSLYRNKIPTRKAIKIYEDILAKYPEDKDAIWLLNVAAMVVGAYPDIVNEKWLIDPQKFKSTKTIDKFHNVAFKTGVGEKGLAGGCAFDDFNNDGFVDIITGTTDPAQTVKYFQNKGDGSFQDNSEAAGMDQIIGGLNLTHADYNNDGYLDVFILRGAWDGANGNIPNSLLRNNGDGTFTDVTLEAKIYSTNPTQTAAWSDINRDGWLDLFIANESSESNPNNCELFINNQDGSFTDYAEKFGLTQRKGFFKGCTIGDINNDGWPDIYLSDYNGKNTLYVHNEKAALDEISFKPLSNRRGVSNPERSFPVWMFDYNNDGLLDIFVSPYGDPNQSRLTTVVNCFTSNCSKNLCPYLYLNKGDETFENIASKVGLNEIGLTMGCNFGDLNMDGNLDLFLATGDPDYSTIVPNKVYLNSDEGDFFDVTTTGGFGNIQKGHSVGFADFDNDGDEDIYCVLGGVYEGDFFRNALYENPKSDAQFLGIKLIGAQSNRSAIGSRLCLTYKAKDGTEKKVYRTIGTGSSFGGNSLRELIGLENASSIISLEIDWTHRKSKKQTFKNLKLNQFLQIVEGKTSFKVY